MLWIVTCHHKCAVEYVCELWTPNSDAFTQSWTVTKTRKFHQTVEEICKLWCTKNGSHTSFAVYARRKKSYPSEWIDNEFIFISDSTDWRCFWRHLRISTMPQDSSIPQPIMVTKAALTGCRSIIFDLHCNLYIVMSQQNITTFSLANYLPGAWSSHISSGAGL